MRVTLTSHFNAKPDTVWQHVQTSRLLHFIASPLIRFMPLEEPFPDVWSEGHYRARMLFLGVLPIGNQTIGIELPEAEGDTRVVRDNGHGSLIKRWDHWIFIEPDGQGTRYTDRVDVEAGLLTPFIALFARVFYTHRQRRWKQLVASGFAPLD